MVNQKSNPLHIENTVNQLAREELRLPQAFTTYRNMLQDEYIGGGVNLVKSLLNKQGFSIKTPDGATEKNKRYIAKLNTSLENMEGLSKTQFINYALSCMEYGVALFEVVPQRVNGDVVFKTFSPIHPKDVHRYVFKRNKLEKLILNPAENDGVIVADGEQTEISGDRVIMIRLNPDLDNPLGRSVLQRCFTVWKSKQIASEYELIGISKDLSGSLRIKVPTEYINDYYSNPASPNALYVENLLNQAELLHAGKSSQVLISSDTQENGVGIFDIDMIGNSGGTRFDVNTTIERYNKAMLITLYTDILALGNGATGSYSLASSKTSLLGLFMESLQNAISEGFVKAIDYVTGLNGTPINTTLDWEDVNEVNGEEFTRGWQRLAQGGLVTPDEDLEAWLRESLGAPKADYNKALKTEVKADPVDRLESDKEK